MKQLVAITFLIWSIHLLGQTPPDKYFSLVKKADSLYKAKDFKNSANTFSQAFKTFGWKGFSNDRYNAACSWSLASVPDSAFNNLERIVMKANYSNLNHVTHETDLLALHDDLRWNSLIKKIKDNRDKEEINFNKPLIRLFDSLVTEDQKWRGFVRKFDNQELGSDTISRDYIVAQMKKTDSLNFYNLRKTFDEYGYPNYDLVGQDASHNFWLLVQHQDLHPDFQEEVLNKMKVEADKGKAYLLDYAYLVDRVKVNTGQLQIYGSQMTLNSTETSYEPRPVIDPEKLNERRKSVGLDPIENYIEVMNTRYFGTLKKK
jgi:hypothetical protein